MFSVLQINFLLSISSIDDFSALSIEILFFRFVIKFTIQFVILMLRYY